MKLPFQPILFSALISSFVMITGCSPSKEPKSDHEQNSETSTEVQNELKTAQIKPFPSTPNDAHDIALLVEYDQKFNTMNAELENELKKMLDEGNLSPEFELTRKQDSVRSSLAMLKDLDLKTEQGRYIQGLLYQYWEKQDKKYKETPANKTTSKTVKGVGDLITANNQLEYWKSQNSYKNTEHTADSPQNAEINETSKN